MTYMTYFFAFEEKKFYRRHTWQGGGGGWLPYDMAGSTVGEKGGPNFIWTKKYSILKLTAKSRYLISAVKYIIMAV